MSYQRGALRKVHRKAGDIWVLRYRVTRSNGGRVENTLPIGLVRDFPKETDARLEADRLGLLVRINEHSNDSRIRFDALAEHYLKTDFGADAIRPKSINTISIVEHYVRDYLIAHWGPVLAEEIKPLKLQRWLKSLHEEAGLAWTTVSKIRGIMLRIFKIGIRHELVAANPVEHVEARSKSTYRPIILSPNQTFAILDSLENPLHFALVLTCAATGIRSSEVCALRWADILWENGSIRVSKRWARGEDGETKTESSDGHVPLHPILSSKLDEWRKETPYANQTDFVFPSFRAGGRKPIYAASFVADYLRPAAIAAGVVIKTGQRFGLHNLRHSLSTWLVNKAKVEPKIVQGILRHSKVQTTLDIYTQEDCDETRAAQGQFLAAVGMIQ
jgi:integrase